MITLEQGNNKKQKGLNLRVTITVTAVTTTAVKTVLTKTDMELEGTEG